MEYKQKVKALQPQLIADIQALYIAHTQAAIDSLNA